MMKLLKKLCSICFCAAFLMAGCIPAATQPTNGPTDPTDPTVPPTEPAPTSVLTEAPPKSLKILAIGNSFSIDAMQYLYQIAEDAGVEEIVLGNLYVGGCSLSQHLDFANNDTGAYDYYKNTDGYWGMTKEYKLSDALVDEEWDYITMQQSSGLSGIAATYEEDLGALVDYVRGFNTSAQLVWHMTWAYQADSTHEEFPRYDSDQSKMYGQIVDCVKTFVVPDERISFVIPAGTAIQNARTSFLGDTLTRDGFHLDKQIGRYVAGMAWYAAITRSSVADIDFNPAALQISDDMIAVAKEAAENAVADPYNVTQSGITEGARTE